MVSGWMVSGGGVWVEKGLRGARTEFSTHPSSLPISPMPQDGWADLWLGAGKNGGKRSEKGSGKEEKGSAFPRGSRLFESGGKRKKRTTPPPGEGAAAPRRARTPSPRPVWRHALDGGALVVAVGFWVRGGCVLRGGVSARACERLQARARDARGREMRRVQSQTDTAHTRRHRRPKPARTGLARPTDAWGGSSPGRRREGGCVRRCGSGAEGGRRGGCARTSVARARNAQASHRPACRRPPKRASDPAGRAAPPARRSALASGTRTRSGCKRLRVWEGSGGGGRA
jgi:hypothetical protein